MTFTDAMNILKNMFANNNSLTTSEKEALAMAIQVLDWFTKTVSQ